MNQELSTTEAKQMRPIIFSTPMVKAILERRKTQTRRLVKPGLKDCSEVHKVFKEADWKDSPASFVSSFDGSNSWYCRYCGNGTNGMGEGFKCPYGKVGDILYVRETWGVFAGIEENNPYIYRADGCWNASGVDGPVHVEGNRWRPSIHMARAAARIFLKITDISVERLQDITEEDAIAEGIMQDEIGFRNYDKKLQNEYGHPDHDWPHLASPVDSFKSLWESINGKWNENPWIWKISFQRIEKP